MRGFPLINGALIMIALCAALVPLIRLTSAPQPEIPFTVATGQGQSIPVTISARYAHTPTEISLSHLGKTLWQTTDSETMSDDIDVEMLLPKEGIDLLLEVTWPPGTPTTALEITLEPESLPEQSKFLWGEGQADDILTFKWHE